MKKKVLTLSFLLIGLNGTILASEPDNDTLKRIKKIEIVSLDTTGYESAYVDPDENLNDLFAAQIDSLVSTWYMQNSFSSIPMGDLENDLPIISIPDSVYINRLQSIDSYVDLSFNQTVKNFIELYTQRRKQLTEVMLGLSSYYFPLIEEQLDKYNLPMELKYMAVIESALNPTARSRANAIGLWQFMYHTGKMYRLEIGTFVDERKDPLKSTEAAAKYLNDLYQIYKDWHLVIAAYNCGPGNVNKAIRRSGGTRDYWSIYYKLPRETRGYVPAFIAAAYVMNYYQSHNLNPRYPDFSIATDTIYIHEYLHFKQVSAKLDIPIAELQSLNPQYRMDIVPGKKDKAYPLRIPMEKVGSFIDQEAQIFAYKREEIFPNNEILVPKGGVTTYHASDVQGKEKIIYKVKSGDTPGFIAEWFHVRLNDLRYWNNIQRNMIRAGQKLTVYVPQGTAAHYAEMDRMSFQEKQQHAKKKPVVSNNATLASAQQIDRSDPDYVYYTVRSGDTLWSIARLFPGVSNNDIMRLNNMNGSKIKPGQKLKIQAKSN